jgi:hypothetical protein
MKSLICDEFIPGVEHILIPSDIINHKKGFFMS